MGSVAITSSGDEPAPHQAAAVLPAVATVPIPVASALPPPPPPPTGSGLSGSVEPPSSSSSWGVAVNTAAGASATTTKPAAAAEAEAAPTSTAEVPPCVPSDAAAAAPEGCCPTSYVKRSTENNCPLPITALEHLRRQVFISHTGRDGRAKDFSAVTLRQVLEYRGVPSVFMDFTQLKHGEEWAPALVAAAANSQVMVAVVSENYTRRFWCMLELDLAMHHPQLVHGSTARPTILPVYFIDPKSAEKCGEQTISEYWHAPEGKPLLEYLNSKEWLGPEWASFVNPERWEANMKKLKEIQNYRLSSFESRKDGTALLAGTVAARVLEVIPPEVHVGDGIVGLEEQVLQLLALLGQPGQLGLWLCGIGGSGKSTLAKRMLRDLDARLGGFNSRVFVELDLHDSKADTSRALLEAVKQLGGSPREGAPDTELVPLLRNLVRDKKVMFVLDNVNAAQQLDTLLPVEWGEGSVVIVTSRKTGLSDSTSWQMLKTHISSWAVRPLDDTSARQLFRQFAGEEGITKELEEVERDILSCCNKLPLALKLVGAQLEGNRQLQAWKGALALLEVGRAAGGSSELESIVDRSLKALHKNCTCMFLDVATVLRGERKEDALHLWGACYNGQGFFAESGLDTLKRHCLVEEDDEGRLAMHDILMSLGRGMVLDPRSQHYGSHVWAQDGKLMGCAAEAGARAESAVHAAVIDGSCPAALQTLYNLAVSRPSGASPLASCRILVLQKVEASVRDVAALLHQCKSRKLLWLDVEIHTDGQTADCVNLGVQTRMKTWMAGLRGTIPQCLMGMTSLIRLRLSGWGDTVTNLPNSISRLSALTELQLSGFCNIRSLPPSLGRLTALRHLELRGCFNLKRLPDAIGQLVHLTYLEFDWCLDLRRLPDSLGDLVSLQHLRVHECHGLQQLPESLGGLSSLQHLSFFNCFGLHLLPESLGGLVSLQHLSFFACFGLQHLPESLGRLVSLQHLSFSGCDSLQELPESIGGLVSLQHLRVSGCGGLQHLPDAIGGLVSLKHLDVSDCKGLQQLPEPVSQLKHLLLLIALGCDKLTSVPTSSGQLTVLH